MFTGPLVVRLYLNMDPLKQFNSNLWKYWMKKWMHTYDMSVILLLLLFIILKVLFANLIKFSINSRTETLNIWSWVKRLMGLNSNLNSSDFVIEATCLIMLYCSLFTLLFRDVYIIFIFNPLLYSCLKKSMAEATVHGVEKSSNHD